MAKVKRLGACFVTFGERELGWTSGGVEFEHAIEYADTEVDQVATPVDSQITKSTVSVTVPLAVYDGEDIEAVLFGAKSVVDSTDPAKKAVDVYDASGVSISTKAAELKCVPKSGNAEDSLMIFKAAPKTESVKLLYKKDEVSVVAVRFVALPESEESDRLYRFGDPTVVPA